MMSPKTRNELLSHYTVTEKPQPAAAGQLGHIIAGSSLPVSLGVPQKRVRGGCATRTDELLGTLMGMQIGNNTVKVLETAHL